MRTVQYSLLVIGLVVIGSFLLVMTGCSKNKSNQEQSIQYHCPMHPAVTSDRPGSCKICGMDLVPIEQEEEHDTDLQEGADNKNAGEEEQVNEHKNHMPSGYATVKINPEKQQLIGVKIATVKRQALIHRIRVVGEVAHDPEMYQAQTEYLKTRSYGQALREAARIKLEHMGMSTWQISKMERSGKAKRNLIVAEKDPIFWIYTYFYEADLPHIKPGQKVIVTIPTLNDEVFVGELKALRAHIDTKTRSVRGIVEIEDTSFKLRPGLFVNVEVAINLKESLVLPTSSVIDTGERQVVFVKKEKGTFEPRQVKLGTVAGQEVQVFEGIDEGEEVVISANFMIDSESKLRAVLKRDGSTGGHQH